MGIILSIMYVNDLTEISKLNIFVIGSTVEEVYQNINNLSNIILKVKWVDYDGLALNLKRSI